jgi:hypothetical protein
MFVRSWEKEWVGVRVSVCCVCLYLWGPVHAHVQVFVAICICVLTRESFTLLNRTLLKEISLSGLGDLRLLITIFTIKLNFGFSACSYMPSGDQSELVPYGLWTAFPQQGGRYHKMA